MRAVVQRVSRARVTVGDRVAGEIVAGEIRRGLLVLLGVGHEDSEADAGYLADKIAGLRVFEDDSGKMNRAVGEVQGSVLVVSQFTLYGDVRRGSRRSARKSAHAVRIFRRPHPDRGPALRNRRISGDDAGGAGQ